MSGAKIIHLHAGPRAEHLKQVRVWTAARALEIAHAEENTKLAREALADDDTDKCRTIKLEILVDRLDRLVSAVMR